MDKVFTELIRSGFEINEAELIMGIVKRYTMGISVSLVLIFAVFFAGIILGSAIGGS